MYSFLFIRRASLPGLTGVSNPMYGPSDTPMTSVSSPVSYHSGVPSQFKCKEDMPNFLQICTHAKN